MVIFVKLTLSQAIAVTQQTRVTQALGGELLAPINYALAQLAQY
jgi:hypothetical protein